MLSSLVGADLKKCITHCVEANFAEPEPDSCLILVDENNELIAETNLQHTAKLNNSDTHVFHCKVLLHCIKSCEALKKLVTIAVHATTSIMDGACVPQLPASAGPAI